MKNCSIFFFFRSRTVPVLITPSGHNFVAKIVMKNKSLYLLCWSGLTLQIACRFGNSVHTFRARLNLLGPLRDKEPSSFRLIYAYPGQIRVSSNQLKIWVSKDISLKSDFQQSCGTPTPPSMHFCITFSLTCENDSKISMFGISNKKCRSFLEFFFIKKRFYRNPLSPT